MFYAEKRERSDIFSSEEKLRKGIRISLVQYVIILMLNLLIESLLEGKKHLCVLHKKWSKNNVNKLSLIKNVFYGEKKKRIKSENLEKYFPHGKTFTRA